MWILFHSVHSTVSHKTDDTSFCEELDTIKDERYSMVVAGSTKSRINSALASNHSSYIEMHPRNSVGYLAAANSVVMQLNPSYATATTTISWYMTCTHLQVNPSVYAYIIITLGCFSISTSVWNTCCNIS